MSLDFVSFIPVSQVSVYAQIPTLREYLLNIGGFPSQGSEIAVNYSCEQELATIISTLQKLDIPFSDQLAGWPPATVFDDLKDKGMVSGNIKRISWLNPKKYLIS
ncbi:hypothetical protein L2744_10340 [Shewanella profunda]|uniref:hypothetical protein n=1 Tax=Shewanella profunda TaxID=254793 RepID=UPI00200DB247|nr:hypothetical protein [Shewanella profunda]MCL1089993.1 hypothetical protein [Shewanella profunda]